MKKIYTLILVFFISFTATNIYAQTFEIRIIQNEEGYLAVQMRETSGIGTPTTTDPIVDISFEIRWLTSEATDVALICTNNDYNLVDGMNQKLTSDSYDFRVFQAMNTPFYVQHDWITGVWETLAVFEANTGTGTANFEISPHQFGGYDLNWNYGDPPVDYLPIINGSVANYSIPTIVYNYVWTGAAGGPPAQHNGLKWENTANWEGKCPGDSPPDGSYPYFSQTNSYVLIPSGLSKYPEMTTGDDDWGWACNRMLIQNGAHVSVPDLSTSPSNPRLFIDGDLIINDGGKLIMKPKGPVTVTGSTQIDNSEGVEIQADATGVGSFIDNGTIAYGAKGGSAKVQTYLANAAGAGDFYIHTVGPTVDEENYGGTGTGAYLSAFNIAPGSTYAYSWDESQPSASGWQNITSLTYEVITGDGIALSTTDATAYTMNMKGELITGDQSVSLTFSNNHYELISNPYPSSIDFDAFATDAANSGTISNKYWLWDPASGNYITRAGGSGGQQHIQVGQAFFVETTNAGTVTFKNSFRAHSTDAFREVNPYELTMNVIGGNKGFKDELIVRFVDDATFGYDNEIDAEKRNSMYDDATSISSIEETGIKLAINFLPVESLLRNMVSVPVSFRCGNEADYTFNFTGMESFANGSEIWLEDKEATDWININVNPQYTFHTNAGIQDDRFVLHFFGPTSIYELGGNKTVDIFSWKQFAFVRNNTKENLEKIFVYNMGGSLIKEIKVSEGDKLVKFQIPNGMGYYVVKAITQNNVFTNKILIEKY